MSLEPIRRLLATHFVWILPVIVFVAGVFLLMLANGPLSPATHPEPGSIPLWHDVTRDIGIAFIVAAAVAAIFELHARTRFHVETISGVLRSVMGDMVGQDVWNEVKAQVIDRSMIRREPRMNLRVEIDDSLPPGLIVLWMRLEYEIHGLKSKPSKVVVEQYLDDYMKDEAGRYPRFERVIIGRKVYQGVKLDRRVNAGVFTEKLELPERDGRPVTMVTERTELAHLPGSYNLVMGELTSGLQLHLEGVPAGVKVTVLIGQHMKKGEGLEPNQIRDFPYLLLPGQVIELRFQETGLQPWQSK